MSEGYSRVLLALGCTWGKTREWAARLSRAGKRGLCFGTCQQCLECGRRSSRTLACMQTLGLLGCFKMVIPILSAPLDGQDTRLCSEISREAWRGMDLSRSSSYSRKNCARNTWGFTGEIKKKGVTNSLLVCNAVTQQPVCTLHRPLQVIALSQMLLIFCMQCCFFAACCPGPSAHSAPCFPEGSSTWLSHWLQTQGLRWTRHRE